jgi:hypothetical protein
VREAALQVLVLLQLFVFPQLTGFGAAWALRGLRGRAWLWPLAAGADLAVGWYIPWRTAADRAIAEGHRPCGAAGAMLVLPMMFLTPFHTVLGAGLRALAGMLLRRRHARRFETTKWPSSAGSGL